MGTYYKDEGKYLIKGKRTQNPAVGLEGGGIIDTRGAMSGSWGGTGWTDMEVRVTKFGNHQDGIL